MRLAAATLSILSFAVPALATERIELSGAGAQEFLSGGWSATGSDAADPLVRGCPGFAGAEPTIEVRLAAPGDLHLYLAGDGLAGALAVRPDGVHVCETPNVYGYAAFAFSGVGEWRFHALAAEAGAAISGAAMVSSYEIGTRDAVSYLGLSVDSSILPPLLSEAPLDPFAPPAFGAVAFPDAGELALPVTLEGKVPADEAGPECRGQIDQTRPDALLSLTAEEPLLAIRAESEMDTTLLVMTPGGEVRCSDDAIGYNPALVFENAAPGDYAVWIGVYPGGEGRPATLAFGRTAPDGVAPGAGGAPAGETLSRDAPSAHGTVDLPAEGGAVEIGLTTGEGALAGSFDGACSGEIDPSRPDLLVSVAAPSPLWLFAPSDATDTTLLVMAPDGTIHCNDDYLGASAAVGVDPAEPGDYAVWVGSFGAGGQPATLVVSRTPPDGAATGADGGGPPAPNPFIGRDLPNAVAALDILREEPDFASSVSWTELEETGVEGFTLHGVTIADPSGQGAPISVARIVVSDLDLEGLSATGSPERFAVSVEGIDYAALATAAQAGGPPLPILAETPSMSFAASLLPADGDMAKRDLGVSLSLDGQLGLAFSARMLWPENAMAMGPEFAAMTARMESVELTLDDMGFLAAAAREAAGQGGGPVEELVAVALAELEGALGAFGPFGPGSPRGRLFAAISDRLTNLDAPGTIRIRLSAPEALDAETAFGQLMADSPDPAVVSVEIDHTPR